MINRTSVSSLPGFHLLLTCLCLASSASALLVVCLQYQVGPSVLPYQLLTSLCFCLSWEALREGNTSLFTRFLGTGTSFILDEKRFCSEGLFLKDSHLQNQSIPAATSKTSACIEMLSTQQGDVCYLGNASCPQKW